MLYIKTSREFLKGSVRSESRDDDSSSDCEQALIIVTSARVFLRPREGMRLRVTRVGERSGKVLAFIISARPLANLCPTRLKSSRGRKNARLSAIITIAHRLSHTQHLWPRDGLQSTYRTGID